MEQIRNFADTRQLAWCVHCGGVPDTRDHVPSKVLLDEPLPANLPVVRACAACNGRLSLDEQYLACLLECVLAGSTKTSRLSRAKVRRLMEETPALAARIEQARQNSSEGCSFRVEWSRVERVLEKLARGHALFELNMLPDAKPSLAISPLHLLTPADRDAFESTPEVYLFPEVGSRAMQRMIFSGHFVAYTWVVVQEGRYRYLATVDEGILIRIVLSEYLACQIRWNDC